MLFDFEYDFSVPVEYKESKVNRRDDNNVLVREVDFSFRSSLESIERITIDLPDHISSQVLREFPNCHVPRKWILLKYKEGDFFNEHVDKNLGDRMTVYGRQFHIASILLFPPKNSSRYEGGELIIKYPDEERIIIADETKWTCVFFRLNTWHRVELITSGTRYVFKGFIFENYK